MEHPSSHHAPRREPVIYRMIEIPGERIVPESLVIPKARELVRFLADGSYPYAKLDSIVKQGDGTEAIIVELSIEIGQEPVHEVRAVELVALSFSPSDDLYPEILSLRSDFPQVPHLNLRNDEFPRSPCIYEEPYSIVRLSWTPPKFLERVRDWFRDTARGVLHRDDQPLEPILMPGQRHLIIPADLFANSKDEVPEKLWILPRTSSPDGEFYIARRLDQVSQQELRQAVGYLAATFQCEPQTHGIIRRLPRNLLDLQTLLLGAGVDLLAALRERMLGWSREDAPLDARLVLIVFFPKLRGVDKTPEVSDIWAFLTIESIREIGRKLGYWQVLPGGQVAGLVGSDIDPQRSSAVEVFVLNPSFALNRYWAAVLNGYAPSTVQITAVGVGALGSQIIPKLIRGGYGSWTLIDDDYLLPHNVARHELPNSAVGYPKATLMRFLGNNIIEERAVIDAIVADVLRPGEKQEQIDTAIRNADLVLDFSASVPVARHLSNIGSGPRRVSVFLNPNATDLVILGEDAQRRTRLDCIEMQYYREVISRPELRGHVSVHDGWRIRYAQTCRDLTSTIPEDLVALHSAIASNAIRRVAGSSDATISIWHAGTDRDVTFFNTTPGTMHEISVRGWRLRTDDKILARLYALRAERLPNETGGVSIGGFDLERKLVYVADFIPSPADSKEWPVLYIRGYKGLAERLQDIDTATGGMLQYVGEWHSHPDGFSTNPSADDRKVFRWLLEHMRMDGLPPVMAIVGEGCAINWFVESID